LDVGKSLPPRPIKRAISALVLIVLAGLALARCGSETNGETEREPPSVVAEAARATFTPAAAAIAMKVGSPRDNYEASGLIEPGSGRFRVRVRGLALPFPRDGDRVVVGTSGEGSETTYFVTHESLGNPARSERCWFNPHAPVGSNDRTASVEESVRLVGSVLESLGKEIQKARELAGEWAAVEYAVALRLSASHPRDDFDDTKRRVWGDRNLLAKLDGPIEVAVSDHGTVAGLALGLRGYRPVIGFSSRKRGPRPVSIQATISPTDRKLRLRQPGCLAME
jgi:hypothetical protein